MRLSILKKYSEQFFEESKKQGITSGEKGNERFDTPRIIYQTPVSQRKTEIGLLASPFCFGTQPDGSF